MAIMADITEHKLADEKIQRLNRALAMLSSVNKTIVRLRDKEAMLAEVCRIAVEHGGFRMVWIGELDTETLLVQKTACDGVDDGYLDGMDITVGPGPNGDGPTGRAIRFGLPVASNDIERDPIMSPWREAALARGFRSSASFPLRIEKSVIGAMNFYSDEPDCFDEGEMNLLTEMTADISYALEFIEKEVLRKEAEQLLYVVKQDWEDTFNAITDMVTVHDADFNIIRANKAAEKLLGLPVISMKRDKCFHYYHGEECPPPGCPSCACLKTGQPATFEVFEPHLNMYIEVTAIPRFDRDNNIVAWGRVSGNARAGSRARRPRCCRETRAEPSVRRRGRIRSDSTARRARARPKRCRFNRPIGSPK
jgi:PAS domain-containing protein